MIDEGKFFAWLDGELSPSEAAEIEALVAAEPELQRRAEAHRALGARLHAAFDLVAEAPVPERLLDAASQNRFEVVDFAAARERQWLRPFTAPTQWAAMAATLAIGLVTGLLLRPEGEDPLVVRGGQVLAAASLDSALESGLASEPARDGIRIGMTFRDASGNICRSFSGGASDGLACRDAGDWRIRGLFQQPEGQSGEFRMAAGPDPRLAELIEATRAGEPFEAAAERNARDRGWE